MNLAELRLQFIQVSGRHDLLGMDIPESGVWESLCYDEGALPADFYIHAGQRYLEKRFPSYSSAEAVIKVPRGENVVVLQDLRVLHSVCRLIEKAYVKLPKQRYQMKNLRHSPDITQLDLSQAPIEQLTQLAATQASTLQAVELLDAIAGTYKFEGIFWFPLLRKPDEYNKWSYYHPHLCLWAAMYILEVSYRNNSGAKTWADQIMLELNELDDDVANQNFVYEYKGKTYV